MRPMDGYPTSFGSSRASIFPVAGPASYTQITRGTPPATATGGQVITAVMAGLKFFDKVIGGITDSGNYLVQAIPINQSGQTPVAQPSTTYRLKWTALVTASLGGQSQTINTDATTATDLSGERVMLFALGPK